jgi:hypothetical protein
MPTKQHMITQQCTRETIYDCDLRMDDMLTSAAQHQHQQPTQTVPPLEI